ncbi:hypothetical protein [Actinospica robiniae]|uniref:hypothetical protein n=1 Tax=Actinospica robiniae TaxID=304901 RepID=UPI000424E938|nr:hypothetical protein [Actinospica robiniae]
MTQLYPAGSTLPIQPWLIERIQQRLGHKSAAVQRAGHYEQYLVQRFGAWQVFPVKIGRWEREPFWHELTDDLLSLVLAPVLLTLRSGRWKPHDEYVQLLDPSSGMPIAEFPVYGVKLGSDEEKAQWRQARQLAFLGDPRVGGLIAPVYATSAKLVYSTNRRGHPFADDAAEFERKAAQLVNLPYRDFTHRTDGPWFADHPDKPQGHTNGWKPSPWYQGG